MSIRIVEQSVQGLENLLIHLDAEGITAKARASWDLPAWGQVHGAAVTSPDGAWLELIETVT